MIIELTNILIFSYICPMKLKIFLIAALLAHASAAFSQMVGVLEDDARIVRDTMPNGLVFYLVNNTSVSGYADFVFIQKTGVALEDSTTKGMTYLMECMALTETVNFPDGAIFSFIDDMGLDRTDGLVIDAGDYYTTYTFSDVPVTKNDYMVDSMLLAMFNMSSALIVDDRSVERGKNFFRNVFAGTETLDQRIRDSVARRYFSGTSLMNLPQDELFRRVDSYTTEDVERFYRTRCRPDMQVIVIVGDIDAAAVESKIRSLFQVMPRASGPAPEFPDSVVDAAGGEFFYFKDCEADCARITIDYPLAPVDVSLRTTAVPYIYEYITTLGVDILQSRLLAELEYAPFFAKSADVEIVPFLNRHSLQLSVECAPEDYVDAYVFLMRAVRSMQEYGVTAKEYEKGRSDFFFDLENTYSRRASLDNRYYTDLCVRNFTQGYAMAGIEYFKEYIETAGPMVDSAVVNSFMRAVFSDEDNRTVVCSSPEPAGGLEYFAVDPVPLREDSLYLSPESRRSGASFLASVQGSDKFVNTATGVTSRRLPNGATLAYRHMSVEPGWVYFEAVARGGISLSEDDVDLLRAYVDDVARISINGGLNVFELSRLTNALHIEIDRSISVNGRKITGRFHTSCMDQFIELAVKYFEGSEPDIENFDKYRRMLEGCAPYASNSPEAVFGMLHSRDVRSGYGKELPADVPVSRIDYMSALKFVNMLFSNPAEFSFMFVGDFDETKLLASVYSHIASIPGGRRTAYSRQRERTPFFIAAYDDVEVVPVPMEFPRRLNSCKLTFPCDMTIEDRVLSDITSKVIEREVIRRLSLRGILAEASRRYYSYPEEVVTIDFHFTTKDDVGDMEGMFAGIVMECAEKGVSENEVEAVKRNMDLKAKLREQTDYTYWTGVLRNRYIDRKDFYTRRQAAMDSVSVEDVNSALLDVLDDGRISVLSVVPEEK